MKLRKCLLLSLMILPVTTYASGNIRINSFLEAKHALMSNFYNSELTRFTLYCDAPFDNDKNVDLPSGFDTSKFSNRAQVIEFEHIVPASLFGVKFDAWTKGDPKCVDSKGKKFKGRECADQVSERYRFIQADGHNLAAAIGSVNALRNNYQYGLLKDAESDFGSCDFRVDHKRADPPDLSKGMVARASLYMEQTYPEVEFTRRQHALFEKWDNEFPVSDFECEKEKTVEMYQGNSNPIVKEKCGY